LKRELNEEFGIETIIGAYVAESQHDYSFRSIRLIAYEVKYISGEFQLIDHDEIKWVSPENLSNFDLAAADIPLLQYLT
jgi:8-oxo-dGTP diphosphatase